MLPLTQFEMSTLTCSNFRFSFRCGFLLFIFLSSLSWSRAMTYPKALKMCTSWPLILLSLGHKMGNEVVSSKCNNRTPQLLALMCKKQWPEVGPPFESSHNLPGSLLHGLDAKWQGVVLRIVHQCKWQVPVTMKMCGMIMSWFSERLSFSFSCLHAHICWPLTLLQTGTATKLKPDCMHNLMSIAMTWNGVIKHYLISIPVT